MSVHNVPQFVLQADDSCGFMAALSDPFPPPGVAWSSGAFVDPRALDLPMKVDLSGQGPAWPDYVELEGLALVSRRFVHALTKLGVDNVQLFSAQVSTGVGPARSDAFLVANIVGRLLWLDEERSEVTWRKERIVHVKRLVPLESTPYAAFFTPHELPHLRIVTEPVRQALEGVVGVRFVPVDAFTSR